MVFLILSRNKSFCYFCWNSNLIGTKFVSRCTRLVYFDVNRQIRRKWPIKFLISINYNFFFWVKCRCFFGFLKQITSEYKHQARNSTWSTKFIWKLASNFWHLPTNFQLNIDFQLFRNDQQTTKEQFLDQQKPQSRKF